MIYLDSASSTRPKFFAKDYAQYWMNPNSPHQGGLQANQALTQAKDRIKQALGVSSGVVIIGGTASQLVNYVMERIYEISNCKIFTSNYEHECINKWGDYRVSNYQSLNINKDDIVCWMMTNNITGTIFLTKEIGEKVRKAEGYYIMDITAALGHYPIPFDIESFCDCIFASGHKFHAEKGTGFVWLSDRFFHFLELASDPYDEHGLIVGTPNVPGAIALSYALEHAVKNATNNWVEHRTLANKMLFDLQDEGIETRIVCDESLPKAHSINALYLPRFNADALVNFLSSKEIYISPGHSACADNDDYRVLEAFGLTKKEASQTVRISFGESTAREDIDTLVQGIVEFKNLFI